MARQKHTQKDTNTPPEVRRALESIGLFTRVAQKLGVTPSHAIQVAKKKRKSAPVIKAIVSEVRRIDRESERAA